MPQFHKYWDCSWQMNDTYVFDSHNTLYQQ